MSELLGGSLGRHSRIGAPYRTWWTPIRLALGAVFIGSALSLLTYSHCQRSGWQTPDSYVHMCYSSVSDRFSLFAVISIVALAITTIVLQSLTPLWSDALLFPVAPAVILTLFNGVASLQALVAVGAIYLLKRIRTNYFLVTRILLFIALVSLVISRSDQPQYVIALTPLVLIAGISKRDFVIWQGMEVVFQIVLWQAVATINGAPKGLPVEAKNWALWIHFAATVFLLSKLAMKETPRLK